VCSLCSSVPPPEVPSERFGLGFARRRLSRHRGDLGLVAPPLLWLGLPLRTFYGHRSLSKLRLLWGLFWSPVAFSRLFHLVGPRCSAALSAPTGTWGTGVPLGTRFFRASGGPPSLSAPRFGASPSVLPRCFERSPRPFRERPGRGGFQPAPRNDPYVLWSPGLVGQSPDKWGWPFQ